MEQSVAGCPLSGVNRPVEVVPVTEGYWHSAGPFVWRALMGMTGSVLGLAGTGKRLMMSISVARHSGAGHAALPVLQVVGRRS